MTTASAPPTPVPAHEDVVDAFMAASRALIGLTARALDDVADVSLLQYRALVVLVSHPGPCHIGGLADALGVNPSSATRLVDRLARAGLCRRSRDPQDRRAVRIQVTRRGRDIVAEVLRRRREEIEKLLETVPTDQYGALVAALQSVADAAGEMPERHFQAALTAVPSGKSSQAPSRVSAVTARLRPREGAAMTEGVITDLTVDGIRIEQGGTYRIAVPLPFWAETRVPHDDAACGLTPWLKLGADGIALVTPPGERDAHGNTVHRISRARAEEMIRTLRWMVDAKVEVVPDGG